MNDQQDSDKWIVALVLNHAQQTYQTHAIQREANWASKPPHYVLVSAQDEIGAFNEARRVLGRLGFAPPA